MNTKCLANGIALRLEGSSSYAWGDLYQQGDRFVFNANTSLAEGGNTVWMRDNLGDQSPTKNPATRKELYIKVGRDYWERRGVFIVKADRSLLNRAAQVYIWGANT